MDVFSISIQMGNHLQAKLLQYLANIVGLLQNDVTFAILNLFMKKRHFPQIDHSWKRPD